MHKDVCQVRGKCQEETYFRPRVQYLQRQQCSRIFEKCHLIGVTEQSEREQEMGSRMERETPAMQLHFEGTMELLQVVIKEVTLSVTRFKITSLAIVL